MPDLRGGELGTATAVPAACPRGGQAIQRAFADQVPLGLRDGTKDMEQQFPGRAVVSIPCCSTIRAWPGWENWMTEMFCAVLWENPAVRQRWARRWRSETAVRELAGWLAQEMADRTLDRIVPHALGYVIERALVQQLADGKHAAKATMGDDYEPSDYGIDRSVEEMLGWLVRHRPNDAASVFGTVTGEAESRLDIPRHVTEWTLAGAIPEVEESIRKEFVSRVVSPDNPWWRSESN